MANGNDDKLLTEYAAANDAYLHYDNYSWQVGSVLIAGVFVFWGFVFTTQNPPKFPSWVANLLVFGVMTIWILYVAHNRQIYTFKLHRLREIEERFGFWQHRRFMKRKPHQKHPVYKTNFPGMGLCLDIFVYMIASLGGPLFTGVAEGKWNCMCFGLPAVFFIGCLVRRMDKNATNIVKDLESNVAVNAISWGKLALSPLKIVMHRTVLRLWSLLHLPPHWLRRTARRTTLTRP